MFVSRRRTTWTKLDPNSLFKIAFLSSQRLDSRTQRQSGPKNQAGKLIC